MLNATFFRSSMSLAASLGAAVSAALLLLMLQPEPAAACSCLRQTPQQAFEQAGAVFEGQVMKIDEVPEEPMPSRRVQLEVVQHWKGGVAEETTVLTAAQTAACGFPFQEGKAYLIYATRAPKGTLRVSLCSNTALVEDSQAALEELGAGVTPVNPELRRPDEPHAPAQAPASGGCASCSAGATDFFSRTTLPGVLIALALVARRRSSRSL